jgi:hypothetical protein
VSYAIKKAPSDASLLARRRADILAEYRHFGLDPIRIGGEPISMELALQLELLVDTRQVA